MLKTLQRIVQAVNSAHDFQDALNIMVQSVRVALDTQACSIFLTDRRSGNYVLMATEGLNASAVGKARLEFGRGVVGLVGEREEPVNLADASEHERFVRMENINEDFYKAFLGVPIIHQRQVLGVLFVQQVESRRYDESEEAFLVTLSAQLATVIAHAEATGELSRLYEPDKRFDGSILAGLPCARGVGIGQAVIVYPLADLDAVPNRLVDDTDGEIAAFNVALASVREEFNLLSKRLAPSLPAKELELFDAYLRMLDPESLGQDVIAEIESGNWAQGALRRTIKRYMREFESMDNEYMRERADDVQDVGRRILSHLQSSRPSVTDYPEKVILVGEEISAANLAEVPEGKLAGIVAVKGSRSSHVVILARALGVPAVMGVEELSVGELEAKELIVDGYYGQVYVEPSMTLRKEFQRLSDEEKALDKDLESLHDLPAETQDGHRITMYVNTGLASDVGLSLSAGAEGVGLYRTEVPFLVRDRFPSGEEQRALYRQLLGAFAPRPVTMRTLDVGGDKPLPYFPVVEENPFLGWRGIRISLDHPDIFLVQVRSMMRANEGFGNMEIMLPMVTDVAEVDEAMRLLRKAHNEVVEDGCDVPFPKVGVMIEVPSAVFQARALAKRVDFLSVGSNDLTQYILAVDRNNSHVASMFDSLHPAVLSALQAVVDAGHAEGKVVSLCGEMASDPVAVVLLLAMGFDCLSMNATSLPRMKWVIRQFSLEDAKALLAEVMTMESVSMIRSRVELAIDKAGLGGLIRAGR